MEINQFSSYHFIINGVLIRLTQISLFNFIEISNRNKKIGIVINGIVSCPVPLKRYPKLLTYVENVYRLFQDMIDEIGP